MIICVLECQQGKKRLGSDDNKELVTFQQELTEAVSRNRKGECVYVVVFFFTWRKKEKKEKNK